MTESANIVRPWKEFSQATISFRSGWPWSAWNFRASFSIASFDSAPLLQKKTRFAQVVVAASASASSTARGL